jgi:hypothetical protein
MCDKDSPEYWNKILEEEWLWVIWEESPVSNEVENTKQSLLDTIEFLSFEDLKNRIEKEKDIIIKYWTDNWWFIEFYTKSNDLIWKIWYDWYELEPNNIDYNHLWIEIYWDYQWKWYSKLLYDLYYKYWLENKEVIYPEYDLAQSNSRINLLLSIWYKIKEVYINWVFLEVSDEDLNAILKDIKDNYYWSQWHTYKLVLED